MANLSGTFSNANAGVLQITLSGTFVAGTARDAGFPSSGSTDVLLIAVVNGVNGPAISKEVPTTYYELDYPGGSTSWAISTTTLDHTSGGILTGYGFKDLSLILQLVKK